MAPEVAGSNPVIHPIRNPTYDSDHRSRRGEWSVRSPGDYDGEREMISRYVTKALGRARYRLLEDGSFAATVPGLRGVIATGATLEACRRELSEVIEEWVLVRVARGLSVPALGNTVIKVHRAS